MPQGMPHIPASIHAVAHRPARHPVHHAVPHYSRAHHPGPAIGSDHAGIHHHRVGAAMAAHARQPGAQHGCSLGPLLDEVTLHDLLLGAGRARSPGAPVPGRGADLVLEIFNLNLIRCGWRRGGRVAAAQQCACSPDDRHHRSLRPVEMKRVVHARAVLNGPLLNLVDATGEVDAPRVELCSSIRNRIMLPPPVMPMPEDMTRCYTLRVPRADQLVGAWQGRATGATAVPENSASTEEWSRRATAHHAHRAALVRQALQRSSSAGREAGCHDDFYPPSRRQ